MSQATSPGSIGFFTLPRELRDNIYDLIWQEKIFPTNDIDFEIRAAVPKVRLISRQFKSEYDERFPINSTLRITDHFGYCDFASMIEDLPLAWQSAHVDLESYIAECDCTSFRTASTPVCDSYDLWQKTAGSYKALLARFPAIETTTITLIADPGYCLKKVVEEASNMPLLMNLDVFDNNSEWDGLRVPLADWHPGSGFLEDNTEPAGSWRVISEAYQGLVKKIASEMKEAAEKSAEKDAIENEDEVPETPATSDSAYKIAG